MADTLHELQEEANRGVITAEQYFMTLLSSLPISPVDYTGTLDAIKRSQFNISLFPDVQSTLATLKQVHGVRLGVVTDSMSTTAEKMAWMQHAGLDTSLYAFFAHPLPDPLTVANSETMLPGLTLSSIPAKLA